MNSFTVFLSTDFSSPAVGDLRIVLNRKQRTVSVIDTPGVFDTSMSELQLKSEIENCIMLSLPGPHIFLLVMRLDTRFTDEEKKAPPSIRWCFSPGVMHSEENQLRIIYPKVLS
uniref:AIG1-type G domain-containing protein n=1 Tax=Seriola lalandi dorsalis TaxID=1841481 RepID=A0A3B4XZ51_SERLL